MDWKDIVKSIAPTLGTALGGPMGGMAVKFLGDKLLGSESASETDVADFISSASPDTLLQVKGLENDFKTKMKELEVDVFKLETEDRKDARTLAKFNMWPHITLSAIYVIGYFLVLSSILTGKVQIPVESREQVNILIGIMTAAIPMILQFWFGSSHGSKTKDA